MPYLETRGANLYYEQVGRHDQPLLLCISGADGSCELWRSFANHLQDRYTIVLWDRRGFSRSYITGPQEYDHRLETDADDAAVLIQHTHQPPRKISVIGNSSGAIVALTLLTRHPHLIDTVALYEAPIATFLPAVDHFRKEHRQIYDLYRAQGPHLALGEFSKLTMTDEFMVSMVLDFRKEFMWANIMYWFEREFMVYPFKSFDVETELEPLREKLILVQGRDSLSGTCHVEAGRILAKALDLELTLFPGQHIGHATHASEFAARFIEVMATEKHADV